MKYLEFLGKKGLRTLMIAERELTNEEFLEFNEKYEVFYSLYILFIGNYSIN